MTLFNDLHWVWKLVLGGFILYSALTLVKWLGLGVLQLLQILTLTVVFGLLCLTGVGLMKEGAMDGCLGFVNKSWDFLKATFVEAMDQARDGNNASKAS